MAKLKTVKQTLSNSLRLNKNISEAQLKQFEKELKQLQDKGKRRIEGNTEDDIRDFLRDSFNEYRNHAIEKKGNIDSVLFNDKSGNNPAVLFEVKTPQNKSQMCSKNDINKKALQQLIYYFIKERDDGHNGIKYLIVTNAFEWFIFDASIMDKLFYSGDKKFRELCLGFHNNEMTDSSTSNAFNDISKKIAEKYKDIEFTYFNFEDIKDKQKELIQYYKILSPTFLLNKKDTDITYGLNEAFYNELLYILGLEEKNDNKKTIGRLPKDKRNPASLLELTIRQLENKRNLQRLENPNQYGESYDEQLFNASLQLVIIWINRILFLKLLEGQLLSYHGQDEKYAFLEYDNIEHFDKLEALFFEVLNKKPDKRYDDIKEEYKHIPYLNSSLFEYSETEDKLISISNLDDWKKLPYYKKTILNKDKELGTLEYLFKFLSSYDFYTEAEEKVVKDNKPLIRANVLGLIFEKINGYKDGSFYTPGYITMYMCRESISKAVIQKFNDKVGQEKYTKLLDITNDIKRDKFTLSDANNIVNSLKICDPAVGSGHFLVSALNELIVIKSDLGILVNKKGELINEYEIKSEDDELIIKNKDNDNFFNYNVDEKGHINPDKQTVQEALFYEKQTIIENCLFGVDINPNSVQICRLRLWIELLKNTFYKNNNELETLPNIDINIKCGNSLISKFKLRDTVFSEKNKKHFEHYKTLVQTYKSPNLQSHDEYKSRGELKKAIEASKDKFEDQLISKNPKVEELNKLQKELEELRDRNELFDMTKKERWEREKKIDQQKLKIYKAGKELAEYEEELEILDKSSFEWRFEFPEVLDENGNFIGFDLVIGNPPYFSISKHKNLYPAYETMNYKTFNKSTDIYCLFIERGVQLAKSNGLLNFITSNKWMRAGYGKGIRNYLYKNTNPLILIDIGGVKVFDEATVDTNILFTQKAKNSGKTLAHTIDKDFNTSDSFVDHVKDNLFETESFSSDESWIISSPIEEKIKQKIEKIGKPLKDWNIAINYGIKTGFNEAFIIDGSTKDKLIKEDPKSEEIIKPLLRGRDIKRYYPKFNDLWLINTHNGYKVENNIIPRIDVNKYPAIKKHLDQYYERLAKRYDKGDTPYNLRNCAYMNEFEKDKIVYNDISQRLSFTFLEGGKYFNNTVYFIQNNKYLIYLLGIMNSKLIEWYYKQISAQLGSGAMRLFTIYINEVKIKVPTKKQDNEMNNLANKILKAKEEDPEADTSNVEAEIDRLVYKLYDLTDEEIKIVEGE